MTPWPCHRCGADGAHDLGVEGWCALHFEQLLDTFSPTTFVPHGRAAPDGPFVAEYGPEARYVRCRSCGATWIGTVGETCAWCVTSHENMLAWQAEMTLTPPDVDFDDPLSATALDAWVVRMRTAVAAELITDAQAERAIVRATRVRAA